MQELEKILEEIELEKKRTSLSSDCSNEHAVTEIILLEKIEKIIRNHMNDGWISVEKQEPQPCEFYGDEEDGKLLCPNCGEDLWELKECGFNNCPYCGQAVTL